MTIKIAEPTVAGPSVASIFGVSETAQEFKPIVKTDHAVNVDWADIDIYQDLISQSPAMADNLRAGHEHLKTFDTLSQDLFGALFKYTPKVAEQGEMKASHKLNHKLITELMDTPEYANLRQNTRLDILGSAIATEVMQQEASRRVIAIKEDYNRKREESEGEGGEGEDGEPGGSGGGSGSGGGGGQSKPPMDPDILKAINGLIEQEKKKQDLQKKLDDMKKKQSGNGQGDPGGQGGNPGAGGGSNGQGVTDEEAEAMAKLQQQMQEIQDDIDAKEQQIDEQLDNGAATELQQVMAKAADKADKDIDEVRDFLNAWGMEKGDIAQRIPIEEKKAALERIRGSSKLKEFSKLIGRFRELAMDDQKKKTKDGATNIKSVTTGNKLESILPSEKLRLAAGPVVKRDFYRKYNQKELLQYELENTQKKGKGPIICCVDVSGSMSGQAEKWSKAVALALLEIAQKQRRDYACILFESYVDPKWVYIVPKDSLKPNIVLDIAETFPGGGTSFEPPLKEALKILKMNKFKLADIVFITDGDSHLEKGFLEEFLKIKKEKEFRVKSVLIGSGGYGASDRTLKLFSDDIVTVSKLADVEDEVASSIFSQV